MVLWQVSCERHSTLDTSTKVELDWSKPQDMSTVLVARAESSIAEPFKMVNRDGTLSVSEESSAKSEQRLETKIHDVLLISNQPDSTLTMAPKQKRVGEVNEELLPESPAAERPQESAVDEYRVEFKTNDLAATSSLITSKLEKPTDVAGPIQGLRTVSQHFHDNLRALVSVTEKINPAEETEERTLPLDTPVPTIMDKEISAELNEEISKELDFPSVDWSLTALLHQSEPKNVLSTTVLTVLTDVVPEAEETVIVPVKGEGRNEMAVNGMEIIQSALCDELHNDETSMANHGKPKESIRNDKSMIYAYSLKKEPDEVEDAHRKSSFTSDTCEPNSEDSNVPKKKTVALILDTDAVHIHTTEVSDSISTIFSQHMELFATSDETRKEFVSHISLNQQGLENNVDSTKSHQHPEEKIDRTLQTLVLSGHANESQIFTRNSEPNVTHAEGEGAWTTNNGPQEGVMEPLVHLSVDNGPQGIQRRFILLEKREGLEIHQEPAFETNTPAMNAATSKHGDVMTNISELEITENVQQVVDKESVITGDTKRVALNLKKQSETLEKMETLPSFSTDDMLEKQVGKVIVEVETKPTPPTRQSKGHGSLSDSSEGHFEEAKRPVNHNKHDGTQIPSPEISPTPLNRRHKGNLGDKMLSLDLDAQPTPPQRRRKDKAESQQCELEMSVGTYVEEPLVKPTPPVRRKVSQVESDSTSVVSKSQKLVEPTPPTPFITSLISKPQGTEDVLVNPTPPTRRKDRKIVRDTVLEEGAVEECLLKPTPPVRWKGSQIIQIHEMEEMLVKPTPPARRRDSRNFNEEISRRFSSSTELEKTVTQEEDLGESIIKPTPPVRRKVSSHFESDNASMLSKIQEVGGNIVKPTPPTRRRDSRNVSDIGAIKYSSNTDLVTQEKGLAESLLKPTPPVRRKASNVFSDESKAQEIEATLLKPTPPIRRRNSGNLTDTAVSRISGSCDLGDLTLVTPERTVEETLVKPTPPVRRKASRAESDTSIADETKGMEATSVKPTPPTRRRHSRNLSDIVPIKSFISTDLENPIQEKYLEGPVIKPTPPARNKTSPAEKDHAMVSKTQKIEETLVKPTPSTRRDSRNVHDMADGSIDSEKVPEGTLSKISLMSPVSGQQVEIESDVISLVVKPQEIDETLVKPRSKRKGSKNVSDVEMPLTQMRADEEVILKAPPEETLVKPTPTTHRRDSKNMDEILSKQIESDGTDLDEAMSQERTNVEVLVKALPPLGQEASQTESGITFVDQIQTIAQTLIRPTTPTTTSDSKNDNETVPKYTQVKTNLDKTVTEEGADVEDLVKPTSPVEQDVSHAETQSIEETLERPTTPITMRDSINVDESVTKQTEREVDLDRIVTEERADVEELVKLPPPPGQEASQDISDISIIDKTQAIEETLFRPLASTTTSDSNKVDETVPKHTDIETDLDNTVREERTDVKDLVKLIPKVEQKLSQAKNGITFVDKMQAVEQTISDNKKDNETVPKHTQVKTDFDKTVTEERAHVEDLVKQTPPVEQEVSQAETQSMEETLERPTIPITMRDSMNVDESVPKITESKTDLAKTMTEKMADDLVKPTPPMTEEASQAESIISSAFSKPQELEDTLVKSTPTAGRDSKFRSNTFTEDSESEAQEVQIEPALKGNDNEVEGECVKPSSVSTKPEKARISPIHHRTDTTTTDLDIVKVEEPPIQPMPSTENIEPCVEIQPTIKQDDEQLEKELYSALVMESTEGFTEIERIRLVEVTGNCMYVRDLPGTGVWTM